MEKRPGRATGLLAAGAIAGGILAGTIGAHAADQANDTTPSGATAHVRFHDGGPGRGGPRDGADLAKALGVSQTKLRAAMEAIRDDMRPPTRPDGPPTAAQRKAREEKFAAALAKQLGLSESTVTAALDKVRAAHEANHRANLSERLDAAVKAGKLTSDDKASVLKAFDAGVLAGPGGLGPR